MAEKTEPVASPAEDAMVDEVVERLLDSADASGTALLGEGGLLTEITRAALERALEAEMSEHLGYERGDPARPCLQRVLMGDHVGMVRRHELTDVEWEALSG
ncbi:hypothetical protein ACFW9H_24900, partial [Streptomyces sp. NPDC059533]